MNDRIEKARMQYIYDDWEEYPQEAIEISEREEMMQDSKENFRKAIEDNLPKTIERELVEKMRETYEWCMNRSDDKNKILWNIIIKDIDQLLSDNQK